jgi:hypothetical protein
LIHRYQGGTVSDSSALVITDDELFAINAARDALCDLAHRAHVDHDTQASGMVFCAATLAEDALFDVLNIARSHARIPVPTDVLHNRKPVA